MDLIQCCAMSIRMGALYVFGECVQHTAYFVFCIWNTIIPRYEKRLKISGYRLFIKTVLALFIYDYKECTLDRFKYATD